MTLRIAMWSGPRNISTAMMRSWENRADCAVVDEPFYTHYLNASGADHPMRDEILASQPTDWRAVAAQLTGEAPGGAAIFYQKQMIHHLTEDMEWDWMGALTHIFLIRSPEEMIASYAKKLETFSAESLGFETQTRLYDYLTDLTGSAPPVIDARDVLRDPKGMLSALCAKLAIPFDPAMLSWPAGPRDSDGVWAPHWYDTVLKSTGFAPYEDKCVALSPEHQAVADALRPHYERLRQAAITT